MSVFIGEVPTFEKLPDDPREQAKKILEEASEIFAEVEMANRTVPYGNKTWVVEECVDVILATANLLACYGMDDLTGAIKRKIEFNERRGYVYEDAE